jgi:DNA-binding beta-propeller fold protein YncE
VEINTKTLLMVGDPIHVGFNPRGIVVTPDGKKVYVGSERGDCLSGGKSESADASHRQSDRVYIER